MFAADADAIVREAKESMATLQTLAVELAALASFWIAIPGSGLSPKPFPVSEDAIVILQKVAAMAGFDQAPPIAAASVATKWAASQTGTGS